ncbi:MAG: tRNA (adenosine(37)-N6)-threonylcarbamoyltransferase complex transferase subunit TsaD [Clostridiales Family XIII bacterium]|nr:tRNA (adenosine(37)-N6)-threonylcarbamoyltransferase complex transferase subunit TsaD [Clostridiales Family XIII bacterium]
MGMKSINAVGIKNRKSKQETSRIGNVSSYDTDTATYNLNPPPTILAIESSCDETSVSITRGREVISLIISSQIDIHEQFGGVVPEIASRHHLEQINFVVDEAFAKANMTWDDIDVIAVTKGPGLIGALLIGIASAKAYALALNKPLIGVHHIVGHMSAVYIEHADLKPPFISFVASGGHTAIALVKSYTEYEILGSTRDDAVGEAYDKVARVIGLGYPGGPKMDKIAKKGNPQAIDFKRIMLEQGSLDFSFSGLKTQVINHLNQMRQKHIDIVAADVAASFQEAVVDVIVAKVKMSIQRTGYNKLALAGGVASNSRIRARLQQLADEMDIQIFFPSPIYCTDNAAMIGVAAYYDWISRYATKPAETARYSNATNIADMTKPANAINTNHQTSPTGKINPAGATNPDSTAKSNIENVIMGDGLDMDAYARINL